MYDLEFKPQAFKDLSAIPRDYQERIRDRIEEMRNGLKGDVKRLASFQPPYRLRVGRYRVLFEVIGNRIIVYRIKIRDTQTY
jgi:mRNA interferase RelE/StbE